MAHEVREMLQELDQVRKTQGDEAASAWLEAKEASTAKRINELLDEFTNYRNDEVSRQLIRNQIKELTGLMKKMKTCSAAVASGQINHWQHAHPSTGSILTIPT